MNKEIWKDVPNYEGIYQVSSLGRVKSLGNDKSRKEKILKQGYGKYYLVNLNKHKVSKTRTVHQLVCEAFLGHKPNGMKLVVDHINDDKLDNRLENLQIITQRENAYKTQNKYSSKYKGVFLNKRTNKYEAHIWSERKVNKRIGQFNTEEEASEAYQSYLKKII
jgi:hypothetical protein